MVEIVNVVASGSLGVELDLDLVATDIGQPLAEYNPDKYPGMYVRFEDASPLITVYRTGKYIITGANSEVQSDALRRKFLSLLAEMGIISEPEDEWFAIQNYVCTAEIGQTQDLNTLAITLGLEKTEYEPEQFPGLIYRPESGDCVVLIFATGKVVLTGAKELEIAEETFDQLQQELSEFD